jgi:anti-sigma factor RsiW
MSETFRCDDKEMLVAYLYEEIDAIGRREVERHLRTCAACTAEVAGLEAVRHDLAAWQPPESDLGFTIAQKPAAVLTSSRWSRMSVPRWAHAAAAVLLLATGVAIANVQVKYNSDGLTVSTGWMSQPPPAVAPTNAVSPAAMASAPAEPKPFMPAMDASASREDWRPALVALEQELRGELAQIKRSAPRLEARQASATSVDAAAVLRRVETMLAESEQRQRQEMATRLIQLSREFDGRRSADMMRVAQDLKSIQVRTANGFNNLVRHVSAQPIP